MLNRQPNFVVFLLVSLDSLPELLFSDKLRLCLTNPLDQPRILRGTPKNDGPPEVLLESLGFGSFFVFGFFSLAALLLACWLPETKGIALEDIQRPEPKHQFPSNWFGLVVWTLGATFPVWFQFLNSGSNQNQSKAIQGKLKAIFGNPGLPWLALV